MLKMNSELLIISLPKKKIKKEHISYALFLIIIYIIDDYQKFESH
jgi:hypothetical protein